MKIKTKLRLGFGFLFVVILFFGGISLYYMNEISIRSKVILKDNYETLNFTSKMRSILDEHPLPLSDQARELFNRQLALEEKNITEAGEGKAVAALKLAYTKLIDPSATPAAIQEAIAKIRWQLKLIDDLNMNAIVRKNDVAQAAIERAAMYVIFAASICFLILFSFIVNFPGFVANPLREFSDAIKEISRKNYKQKLEFKGSDEFSELAASFNVMTAELNKWESSNLAKIQSEKLRIEAIIEQMQDAIIGLNEQQEFLFFNKVAGQLMNLDQQNIIGQNAMELRKKNDLLNRILQETGTDKPIKIYADHKESYFQLERREIMVPNYDDNADNATVQTGKAAGQVYILKNITQFKELDEAKTNFIATVSHELKTPISSIKMSLKLMDDERVGVMNPEQKELVQHIREDCGRLLKITSELLDLAQVETGNLQLNFVKSDPRKIAIYAMDAVRFQAEQKSIELELISKNKLPQINVDIEKTAWVLVNFLSNALRYSAVKSKVIVQVIEKNDTIEFSVRDFGKGIEEQYQKRLFEKYFQVPTDGNNKSGSGLGLAISKDFIEAESGKIWVESAIGEGSKFCFSLPVATNA
ncbi:HAMP domain-containing sensor histidine kinase [Pedobacter heparinus]|uniref:histidine kinase n=1 Tax=Pedobacter heparinus (strain ATCC 13125 / DSM 2366 / CIP 104194 / JCM 7457 / NBRC 12017 / NCIMB 9290 / NRRL B-14731 / HIM 762-3) TaxID=485917 RepID=C6XZL1_PEDHD|nr:sensor histidine kinase [Pedobacter heparinus]ACU04707.1 ATP-binding region ATPase domain protein [Pedobacter heparinus DSM 2366]